MDEYRKLAAEANGEEHTLNVLRHQLRKGSLTPSERDDLHIALERQDRKVVALKQQLRELHATVRP